MSEPKTVKTAPAPKTKPARAPVDKRQAELFDKLVTGKIRVITSPPPVDSDTLIAALFDDTDVSKLGVNEAVLVKEQKIRLDHATAKQILAFEKVPGDRSLVKNQVNALATAMQRNVFRGEITTAAVCFCKADGRVYRINLQHASHARLSLPETAKPVVINLCLYVAGSLDGVRAVYSQYDRNRARGKFDVLASYLTDRAPYTDYPIKLLNVVAAGLTWHAWPTSELRAVHGGDSLAAMMLGTHKDVTVRILELFKDKPGNEVWHIKRATVIAAMYATDQVDPDASREFWSAVQNGLGLTSETDARFKLRADLMVKRLKSNENAGIKRYAAAQVSGEAMRRTCIAMWNAWRDGRPVSRLTTGTRGSSKPPKPR